MIEFICAMSKDIPQHIVLPNPCAETAKPITDALEIRMVPRKQINLAKKADELAPYYKKVAADDAGRSSPRHERVLKAVHLCHAMGYDEPSREQVAFWCGLSPRSGNFNNLLGTLRSSGRIEYPSAGTVQATQAADVKQDPAQAYQTAVNALQPRLRKIIDSLIQFELSGDGTVDRKCLAESVLLSETSGNFNNLLGSLRSAGLIVYPKQGAVKLAEWMRECAMENR